MPGPPIPPCTPPVFVLPTTQPGAATPTACPVPLPNTKAPVDKLKELETVMVTGPNKITAPLIWTSEKE